MTRVLRAYSLSWVLKMTGERKINQGPKHQTLPRGSTRVILMVRDQYCVYTKLFNLTLCPSSRETLRLKKNKKKIMGVWDQADMNWITAPPLLNCVTLMKLLKPLWLPQLFLNRDEFKMPRLKTLWKFKEKVSSEGLSPTPTAQLSKWRQSSRRLWHAHRTSDSRPSAASAP